MTKTPKRSSDLVNGETSEGDPPTSRDSVANALDRWDEEGGAPHGLVNRASVRGRLSDRLLCGRCGFRDVR